ncbi:OmpA family protein [Endomicrobium proavitum]|nr:OmpA family protein [Endomicrobium proavitum]
MAITTSTDNYNISLADNIMFYIGFNVLSGTITGNGFALDGQSANPGMRLLSGNSLFFYGPITFQNYARSAGDNGQISYGGALFVTGAHNVHLDSATIVNFTSSTISFDSNRASVGNNGSAARGGGLFVGGVTAAQSASASSATAVVNFTSSTINFVLNTMYCSGARSIVQGAGLFVGGAVSGGAYTGVVNYSSGGTAVVNFISSIINFTSNRISGMAPMQGGGLFVGGSVSGGSYNAGAKNFSSNGTAVVNFASSTINFSNNALDVNRIAQGGGLFVGGAVSAGGYNSGNDSSSGTALVTFIDSEVNIDSNAAQDGGGMFIGGSISTGTSYGSVASANGIAQVTFAGSTITITGNTASASGGGIYIAGNYGNGASGGQASLIFENANVTIASNTATNGSAIYAVNGASVVFNNTNIEFLWNKSAGNGIAHWDASSYVGLENVKTIKAIGNQANNGGFLYLVNGVTVTFAGTATFDGNKATTNGGALYITGNTSQIIFADGSTITFTNNNAAQGGAVYATAGANVVFTTGAHYVVSNNTATYGGFIAVNNATATFKSGVDFSLSNSSATYGGFLYATNNAIANFENVYASSNSAALGGFIAAESGAVINIGSAVITGNVATSSGGAIYLQTSTANFNSAGGAIVFASNTANGKANDIYAAGSFINFNAVNNQISIFDGIYVGNGGNNTISKTGLGELYISGNNYMQGNFNVTAGSVTIDMSTFTFENGNWNVTTSSGVQIINSVVTIANTVVSSFTNNASNNNGLLYSYMSTITWTGSNVTFANNAGLNTFINLYSEAIFDGVRVDFTSNTTEGTSAIQNYGVVKFIGSTVTYAGNTQGSDSAVFNLSGSTMSHSGGKVSYISNSGVGNFGGGAAIGNQGSFLIYENEEVTFIDNFMSNTSYGGGALYNYYGEVKFSGSEVLFDSNSVTENGGAILNFGAQMEFTDSKAIFKNNAGYNAGAVGSWQSTTTFSDVVFDSNVAVSTGGAIAAMQQSYMYFVGVSSFIGNTATDDAGAIGIEESYLEFSSKTYFTGNKATAGVGGAIGVINSAVAFNNDAVFTANTAGANGGALYSYLSTITFTGANAIFTGNKALTGSGGAIYAVDDLVFDGANVDFTGNEALSGNGGAIFADDTILTIKNAVMTFMNNKALLGGAVYASNNSNITLSGRGSFTGNEANASGAAVYVTGGSTVTIEAANGDIIFSGNKVAGTPNDIYADNNSRLNLITSGTNTISIAGGILSNTAGSAIEVNKTGTGTLFMGGDNEVWGSFTATAGKVVLLESATFKANNIIFNGAGFDMTDDIDFDGSYLNTVNVKTFESDTQMLMDVFENGTSDQVFADSATIGGDLTLKVETGNYNNDTYYDLIISTVNQIYGAFTSSQIVTNGLTNLQSKIYYEQFTSSEVIRLWLRGVYNSNFESIGNATFNQTEVAKAFDKLSVDNTVAVHQFISNLWNSGAYTNEEKKSILSEISPYFITNVIESAAQDSDNNELYDRIKNHSTRNHTNSAIWAQVTGGNTKLGGDENSLGEYKDNRYGVMAGFDIYFGSMSSINKTMLGIYVNYKDHSITQQESKATLNKMGLGFYGGYIEESYEIKAMISGSKDSYETTRAIKLNGFAADRTASGKFDGLTLGADVEGALKYGIAKNTIFRPYAGAELKNVSYDGFTEAGASELNLKVEAGNYLRTTARLGAGVNYDDKTWAGYVNLEGKYLLTGKKYEIESVFEGTDVKFLSRGYEENGLILGATLGGSVRITEGLKFFINANAYTAEKFTNLYANAGLRYNFCGITHKEKPVVVEQPKPEPIPEPAVNKSESIDMSDDKVVEEQKVEALARRERPMIKKFDMKAASFAVGKATLTPRAKADIENMANEMKKYEYTSITIEGHTDSTGKASTNRTLSKARAKAVHDEFVANGISAAKMYYIGFGHTMPADTNKTVQGRANNRRVEIFVE